MIETFGLIVKMLSDNSVSAFSKVLGLILIAILTAFVSYLILVAMHMFEINTEATIGLLVVAGFFMFVYKISVKLINFINEVYE